jgi:hypothetical protein
MFLVYLFEYTTLSRQKQLKNGLAHLFRENSLTILNVYSKSKFDHCTSVGILIFKVNFKGLVAGYTIFAYNYIITTYICTFSQLHSYNTFSEPLTIFVEFQ